MCGSKIQVKLLVLKAEFSRSVWWENYSRLKGILIYCLKTWRFTVSLSSTFEPAFLLQGGKEQAFDPERLKMLKELAAKPDAYERLARAIAPSIYENEDIKKG